MRRRAGTENVAGIAGFGAAARVAKAKLADEAKRLGELRDKLERYIAARMPDAVIYGDDVRRVAQYDLRRGARA